MKRLFRKIAEWLGLIPKQPKPNLKPSFEEKEDEKPRVVLKGSYVEKHIQDQPNEQTDEATVPHFTEPMEQETPHFTEVAVKLPKDATKLQNLTKYNNPNSVYRNAKGQFASLD